MRCSAFAILLALGMTLSSLPACNREPTEAPATVGLAHTAAATDEAAAAPSAVVAVDVGPVGCVEGIAVNEENEPVAGARITLETGNGLLMGAFPGMRRPAGGSAVTAPDGSFRIDDVPAGRNYVIVGEHDDYVRGETTDHTVEADRITAGVVLSMSAGAGIHGIVSKHGGGPLPDARVELAYAGNLPFAKRGDEPPAQIAFTDREGRYSFRHVNPTTVHISVQADGFASRARTISGLVLQPTQGEQECNFELDPGASLSGRVLGADGSGIPGACLVATSLVRDNPATTIAFSDAEGHFVLNGMTRDSYELRCRAEGYSEKSIGPVDVLVNNCTLVLARQGSVTGVVTHLTGAPVCSFSLHLMRAHAGGEPNYLNVSRTFETSDGHFTFDGLDAGTYILEARADDAADTRSESFTIEPDMPEGPTLSLRMQLGGTLRGQVRDASGKPLAGALVTLKPNNYVDSIIARIFKAIAPSDEHEHALRTGTDGSYSLVHIPAGTWQLLAEHADAAARAVNDVVVQDAETGPTLPVDIVLPPGASIAGRLVDDGGLSIPHVRVLIESADNSFMDRSVTDAEGRFRFTNLRAGVYQLASLPKRFREPPNYPITLLILPSEPRVEVTVAEGQVVNDVLIRMKEE